MDVKKITEQHHYPRWLLRYPRLIYIHYFTLQILFLRSRVCRRRLSHLIKNYKSKKTDILDAGCGEGQYLIPLSHKFRELNFTGIDHNPAHISFLNLMTDIQNLENCILYKRNISAFLSENISFDLIYIIGVLQYMENPGEILKLCAGSQPRSGQLMVYTPVQTNLHFRIYKWIRRKYGHYDDAQEKYQPVREDQLLKWISSAGYRIVHREYHYAYWGTMGHEIMQSLLILITHWPLIFKWIPGLFFIVLMPIFVSLQVIDRWFRSGDRKCGNGLLLILQK